jgi:hypothetical protein
MQIKGANALITIGKEVFKTKKAAKARVQGILHSYNPDEFLNHNDRIFIENLIYNHPESEVKIGKGIKAIQVRQNPEFVNSICFYIIRTDGTETDFSFQKCITPPTQKALFVEACRRAIRPFVSAFRRDYFEKIDGLSICEVLGTHISITNSEVDHIPPLTFEKIVREFIVKEALDIQKVRFKPSADNEYGKDFEDEELMKKWIDFHNKVAHLRVVSAKANGSQIVKEANAMRQKLKKTI